jgi:hypothetical protein
LGIEELDVVFEGAAVALDVVADSLVTLYRQSMQTRGQLYADCRAYQ